MNIIEVTNLRKKYGDIVAVQDLSFHVEKGELFGFLGVNGAGKSTTINMLCTLFSPTQGSAKICGLTLGKDNQEIRRRIGMVQQQNCLDDILTVKENLMIRGSLYESRPSLLKTRLQEVSKLLDLQELLNRPFGKLSGGQKRRCEIARALMHSPEILFLDEPTTGLDPATRKTVWKCIEQLRQQYHMTVFLTTHYMEEAAQANHIVIIDKGKLIEYGTPYELKDTYVKDQLVLFPTQKQAICMILDAMKCSYQEVEQRLHINLSTTMEALPILEEVSSYLQGFEVLQGTMDDVFLRATGKKLKEEGK